MTRRTEHTARKAIEQLAGGKIPDLIEEEELSSLEAYIRTMPNLTLIWLALTAIGQLDIREQFRRKD